MLKSSSNLIVYSKKTINDVLMRIGSTVSTQIPLSDFGTATASDVASGKTFTSSAGLKVTGTANVLFGENEARVGLTIQIINNTSRTIEMFAAGWPNKTLNISMSRGYTFNDYIIENTYIAIYHPNGYPSIAMNPSTGFASIALTTNDITLVKLDIFSGTITLT